MQSVRFQLPLVVLAGLLMLSHTQAASPVMKISVSAAGQIAANGSDTDLVALEGKLAELSSEHGSVWYYREASGAEPPPQAMEVIELIVKYRLPVSMSAKPDFSDTVDAKGNSVPRKP